SYNLSINPGSLRAKPLVIKVTYPSGSTVQITLSADFSSWSELAITDDNGVEISVEDPNDPSGISPLIRFEGLELWFQTQHDNFIRNLANRLNADGGYSCTSRPTDGGIEVICSKH